MQRPGSGMRAPQGPVSVAHMKGFRPMTSAANSGMLASIAKQPMTMMRPGSGLKRVPTPLGTASLNNLPMGVSVGLSTELKVDARPVTQQGLMGAPAKSLGPGRQIADRSYYLQEIKTKVQDITKEIDTMQKDMERFAQDGILHTKLQRRYDDSIREVRDLEGQLADYNLTLDKLRTHTDVNDIVEIHSNLKPKNEELRQRIDEIFMKRSAGEKLTEELEQKVHEIHESVAEKLGENVELLEEFHSLQDQSNLLNRELEQQESRLVEMDSRIRSIQQVIQSPAYQQRAKAQQLQNQRSILLKKKEELIREASANLSPDEMRERLLQKVKDDNTAIKTGEDRIKSLEELLETRQDEIQKREQELIEAKRYAQKSKKYEALLEREKKMSDFIQSFPHSKQVEIENREKSQRTITSLLEQVSKNIVRTKNLPNKERLNEMKQELTFKEKTTKHSVETLEHLKEEREKRKQELQKIENLDDKITKEIASFKQRIVEMEAEMSNFEDPETIRVREEAHVREIQVKNEETKRARDQIRVKVQQASQGLEKIRRDLKGNAQAQHIASLMQKLRTYSQIVYQLSDFIDTRKRESEYQSAKEKVFKMTEELNRIAMQTAA